MKFENGFEVDAPVDEVWNTVLDVERVAPTVPGAKVLEQTADNAYKVGIKVKLGPMTMTYNGDVEVVDADESAHTAKMKVRAKEARGQGTADADVTMVLTGDDAHTSGKITTDVKISGKAASMGRGVMQDVAGKMVGTFADNLATMLTAGEAAPEEAPAAEAPPAAEEPAKSPPPKTAPPPRAAAQPASASSDDDDALDLGSLGGAMAMERIKDPLVLGLLLLAFLLGRWSRRG